MGEADRPWRAGAELAAIWQRGEGLTLALSQATQALAVMLAVLAARGVERPQVWVPGYICEGALGVARAAAARLRFYPVTESMTPDWTGVEAMLADGAPQLFVLAHFFGMESDGTAARAFCDRVGGLLHEDCAHVLRPVGGMGSQGDFVSFSPRKYCGIPDGGILVARGRQLAAEAEVVATTLSRAVLDTRQSRFLDWRNRTLPWLRRTGPMKGFAFDVDPNPSSPLPAVWMTPHSRARLRQIGSHGLERIASREAGTVRAIEAAMSRFVGITPLPRIAGTTPYMLGFRAASPERAARVHDVLRRAGAVVGSWPGLPPEVRSEPQRYGEAMALRRSVVRLTPRFDQRRRPLDFVAALPAEI